MGEIKELTIDKPYRNVDNTMPTDALYSLVNGIISLGANGKLSLQSRPGLTLLVDIGTNAPIDGFYWWDSISAAVVVSAGRIFKITSKYGDFTEITGDQLISGRRVTFTEAYDEDTGTTLLFMANGGKVVYTDGESTYYISDVNCPVAVSHVVCVDTYLICNSLTAGQEKYFFTSTVGKPLDFTTLPHIYTAQLIPDTILSMQEIDRKLYLIGYVHTEVWYNTGAEDPFSPVGGVGISSGSTNPYSVIKIQNMLGAFNNYRDGVIINGYDPNVISVPYAKVFNDLGIASDCETEYIASLDGHKYLLFNFFNDKRTIVYDITVGAFYEWGTYDTEAQEMSMYVGRCYDYCHQWGMHLIGDRETSSIYIIDTTNITDNGKQIKTVITTGVYDRGISTRKKSNALYINIRRGDGKENPEVDSDGIPYPPYILVRWADNGKQFGDYVEKSLGIQGDDFPIMALRPMGTYYTRRYEITLGDKVKLVLNGIQEEVEALNV